MVVQGIGYWIVYRDPDANRGIVQLGVVYKAAFSGLAIWYWITAGLLHPVFGVFGVLDIGFLVGFVMFLMTPAQRRLA